VGKVLASFNEIRKAAELFEITSSGGNEGQTQDFLGFFSQLECTHIF
jgi:hypothetical protein